jgi:hypothetical protein
MPSLALEGPGSLACKQKGAGACRIWVKSGPIASNLGGLLFARVNVCSGSQCKALHYEGLFITAISGPWPGSRFAVLIVQLRLQGRHSLGMRLIATADLALRHQAMTKACCLTDRSRSPDSGRSHRSAVLRPRFLW